jgi:predicted nucleotidyltransferase
MEMQEVLNKLVDCSCHIFEKKLTGVYLHGSIAMGCFNPRKSDIDILVVVEDAITDLQNLFRNIYNVFFKSLIIL